MKRNITVTSLSITLKQDTDIVNESKYVLMNYGPVRAGLTTLHATLDQQHTELLNSLVKQIETLQSRYYTDLNTLSPDTEGAPVVPLRSTIVEVGTK